MIAQILELAMPQKTLLIRFDIRPYRTQEIMGRVSIAENSKALPVSMRLAEFIPDGNGGLKRNLDYNNVSELDPTKPVWVVHGMNSSEREGVGSIAHELSQQSQISGQIVTIHWEEAANTITTIEYGNGELAKTANKAFQLVITEDIDHDHAHGYPVTAFAMLVGDSITQGDNGSMFSYLKYLI